MQSQQIFSSHQPKATLPERGGLSGFSADRNTKNEPPGGKINLPFSDSTRVVSGVPRRTKAFTPPVGSPVTSEACSSWIFGSGGGQMAVLEGVTCANCCGVPGGVALNQNWARNGACDISVTVHTLTCRLTQELQGLYSIA